MAAARPSALLLLAAAVACRAPAPGPDARSRVVHFGAINDWHGALQPRTAPVGVGARYAGGLAVLAGAVDRAAAARPGLTLLDGGDCFQGDAAINLSNGLGAVEALGLLGVKAAAVGNHEFDYGGPKGGDRRAHLKAAAAAAPFPFLSANIEEEDGAGGWRPWRPDNIFSEVLFDVRAEDGSLVKLGVYGLTTTSTPTTTRPDNVIGLRFTDLAEASRAALGRLRANGAEITVLVGHIEGDCPKLEGAAHSLLPRAACLPTGEVGALLSALGDEAPDLMVLGHSHTVLAHQQGKTALVEAGSHGMALGLLSLRLGPDGVLPAQTALPPPEVLAHEAPPARCGVAPTRGPLPVAGAPLTPDAEAITLIRRLEGAVEGGCAPAGCALQGLGRTKDSPSALGAWAAAAVQGAFPDADLGVQNGGGLRADLPAGPLIAADWQDIMPFPNTAVLIELSGAQVLAMLEEGAAGRHSFLHVAGARYRIDPARPASARICPGVEVGGRPLDPKATYRVATSNFLAEGGDHMGEAYGRPTPVADAGSLREVMMRAALAAGASCVAPPPPTVELGPCGSP
ncbi:MAG: hypothetical protein RL071_1765 [Pseudomonadota bacterium]|jgi:5'-nucleotidase